VTIPEFGAATAHEYVLRPGGYAVILTADGHVATVMTPSGLALPGGGQNEGESPESAAIRETEEECGLRIVIARCIGVADELVFAVEEGKHYRKRCTFFLADVIGTSVPVEPDHQLVWLSRAEAKEKLRDGSQRWAAAKSEALKVG